MCDFCHKHGDGRKWYLQARNYSADLLSDLRRQKIVRDLLLDSETVEQEFRRLDRLESAPQFLQRMIKAGITRKLKRDHFGQVIPIEDVEQILRLVNSIVQVPCICRQVGTGREFGYCYGVTAGNIERWWSVLGLDENSPASGPSFSDVQSLEPAVALQQMRSYEKEGLCHTVWTFGTPFIGGICNCDRVDCFALQATLQRGVKAFFRAEYVAELNPDLCAGCRSCMRVCQFGAIGYSAANKKAFIDQRACYGCGICRAVCAQGALSLRPRGEVPIAARQW